MQKLKKVFSPGNDKDDETMYGSPATRIANAESGSVAGQPSANPNTATTSDAKDHGISRQILNPGGDKYDELKFGAPTSAQPQVTQLPEDREATLDSRMGDVKEDRSIKRQVLDPSSGSRDESGYGTTEFEPAAHSAGAPHASSVRPDHSTAGSTLSMKSGVLGAPDQRTEERALRSDGIATQDGLSGTPRDEPRNFSRSAALAGAGAAAGAGGAYAATRPHDNIDDSTHTDRSFPLSGGAIAPHSENRPTSSTYSTEAPLPQSTSGTSAQIPGLNTGTAGGVGAESGDAALDNLGLARHSAVDHSGHSHEFNGDPCEVEPAEKTLPHIPGPHATLAANMLDPHVPGEFPTEDGIDPHSHYATGFGQTAEPSEPSSEHHLGRDAALVGGAGAAGLGAHEALKSHSSPTQQSAPSTSTGAGVGYPAPLGSHEALADRTLPTQQPTYSPSSQASPALGSGHQTQTPQQVTGNPLTGSREPEKEHHYGRDAALLGGAGAAGYGADQYLKDRNTTTVPSSTGADGIVTEPTTGLPMNVGKYGAATGGTDANPEIASHYNDPPVGSDSARTQQPLDQNKDHHYGRDAALVGGAGAAGYGADQYLKDRNATGPSSTGADGIVTDPTTGLPMNVGKYGTATGGTDANPAIASHYNDPPIGTQQSLDQNKEHHYGRDAALVGGAGAAGAAGYAALQDGRGDTGPASKTIGPHSSNIANIVDPRVRPEPEKMKDHTTAGPWQSDTLNKLDPKVESNPNKADVKAHGYASGVPTQPLQQQHQQQQQLPVDQDKDHHYGRDAALVGGTGAAAYGATQAYDQHEQDKLAKEQEKQAQHDAKERAKEQEKQAKHDAKEHDKQAKHDAKEAEKAHKKDEEKHAKEQEKLDKHHAKEQEKAEEKRLKEQEKAEEKRQKELEKLQHDKEKEDAKLASARYDEAEAKHNKHNKLHKEAPEEREEKGGIMHRIFHHKHYEREGAEDTRASGSFDDERRNVGLAGEEAFERRGGPSTTGQTAGGESSFRQPGLGGEGDGMVTEPTTGLPMNVGKYGYGSGGTDGNEAIAGHYAK